MHIDIITLYQCALKHYVYNTHTLHGHMHHETNENTAGRLYSSYNTSGVKFYTLLYTIKIIWCQHGNH